MRKRQTSSYQHSTLREKIVEHIFVAELLKCLWSREVFDVEVAHPEVDNSGTDLIVTRKRVIRHIQLKASAFKAKAKHQNVNIALSKKPSGCVVWIHLKEDSLDFDSLRWFGGKPGRPLPRIGRFKPAKQTRGNSEGEKGDRLNVRKVPISKFKKHDRVDQIVTLLLGE